MNKQEKDKTIQALDNMLSDNNNFYLADISGLNAEQNSALRRLCFKRSVSIKVVKNTLLKKALEKNDIDFSQLYNVLVGNTSIMQAEAGNAPAKVIKEFRKKNEKPTVFQYFSIHPIKTHKKAKNKNMVGFWWGWYLR